MLTNSLLVSFYPRITKAVIPKTKLLQKCILVQVVKVCNITSASDLRKSVTTQNSLVGPVVQKHKIHDILLVMLNILKDVISFS